MLQIAGIVNYVVTSNHDNFHVKSGVPEDKIAELFGNAYVERCLKCDKLYRRHVVVPGLGRKCDKSECNGRLVFNILFTFHLRVSFELTNGMFR